MGELSAIDDTFSKYAFTVREIDEVDAYVDYVNIIFLSLFIKLTKFTSFSKTYVDEA